MIMMIMMVMRVMMMMMNIAAMQIKICDHNLIHRVKVDLVFFCFFCPFSRGPVSVWCSWACLRRENIFDIYLYVYTFLCRISTKEANTYQRLLLNIAETFTINLAKYEQTNNVKNGVQRGHWPPKTRLNCLSRPPPSSSLLVDCWSQTLIGYHRHLSCPVWEWFTALVYSSQCIPDIFWIWADWWVFWQDLYSKLGHKTTATSF